MTGDGKSSPTSASDSRIARPKASRYDMFDGIRQTRLKAAEANRKRLLASNAPAIVPSDVKE
jgi:hypothetical protein